MGKLGLPPDGSVELSDKALLKGLLPQLCAVAITFLLTGAALAAVPLFVARELGYGPSVIGLIAGLQFICAVVVRLWAGPFTDRKGPKPSLILGFGLAIAAGGASGIAALVQQNGVMSVAFLASSRIFLGCAEALITVGAQTWALSLAGPKRSALVVGWVGTAMFASMAAGAPIGGLLFGIGGLGLVALCTVLLPAVFLPVLLRMKPATVAGGDALVFLDVARRIMIQCLSIALVGFSYGAIVSFSVVLFEERSLTPPWAGLTLFSLALVFARIVMGSAPDRLGANRTALWSLAVMVLGLGMVAFSEGRILAFAGTWLSGLGYALVYPAIAREALLRVPDRNRGSAMALLASAVTLTLGVGGPALGVMAEVWTTGSVFAFSLVMAIIAMGVIMTAGRRP